MKKITLLSICLVVALTALAQPYYGSGRGLVREIVNKMDATNGPLGDAEWPLLDNETPVFPDEPWNSGNGLDPFKELITNNNNIGIRSTTEMWNGKTLWGSGAWENYTYYLLKSIDWTGKNYEQKAGDANNILLQHTGTGNDLMLVDMRGLESLKFSGNKFRNLTINGGGAARLNEIDLSDNATLEYLAISGCPDLKTLKATTTGTVSVANNGLLFSQIAGFEVTAGTYTYAPQGAVPAKSYPVNKVDFSAEYAVGTTFSDWSVAPVSSENGVFAFADNQTGTTITVKLSNATYPAVGTLDVSIVLTDGEYNIATAADLDAVRNHPAGTFTLVADIDLADYIAANYPEEGWLPIGDETTPFKGTFDGNGHVISGLWIERPTTDNVGLFGVVGNWRIMKTDNTARPASADAAVGARIFDLGVVGGKITGKDQVGGLIGVSGSTVVSRCYINVDVNGNANVGGIVGNWYGKNAATVIEDCYVAGRVSGVNRIGGIAGVAFQNDNAMKLNRVYSINKVQNTSTWYENATGGVIGRYGAWDGNIKLNSIFVLGDTIRGVNNGSTGRIVGSFVGNTNPANLDFSDSLFVFKYLEYSEDQFGKTYSYVNPDDTVQGRKDYQLYGRNITEETIIAQETYSNLNAALLNWNFDEVWTMGNEEYPLPVLKKMTAEKQPTAYPRHLRADVTVTTEAGENGTISTHTNIKVGDDVTIIITPDENFRISTFFVNGENKKPEVVGNKYTIQNISENSTVSVTFESSTTSLNEIKTGIYPTVTNDKVFISGLEAGTVVYVFDAMGHQLLSTTENVLDFSGFANGIYFIKTGDTVTKIVKK